MTEQLMQKSTGSAKAPLEEYFNAFNRHLPYQSGANWLNTFDAIARRISRQIRPGIVLDVSCAYGLLVERLRAYDIEAYGIESDLWAMEQFVPGAKDFCKQGFLTDLPIDPLPRKVDLIVCLEGFKRLGWSEAQTAIANVCQYSEDVLISITPFRFEDSSTRSPNPPEDWIEVFAQRQFLRDLDFDLEPMTNWAMRFKHSQRELPEWARFAQTIRNYENHIWMNAKEIDGLRSIIDSNRVDLDQKQLEIIELTGQTNETLALRKEVQTLTLQVNEMSAQILEWHNHWMSIQNSHTWRLFQALQRLQPKIAPPGSLRSKILIWGFESTRKIVRILRAETNGPVVNTEASRIEPGSNFPESVLNSEDIIHGDTSPAQARPGVEPLIVSLYSPDPWTAACVHLRLVGPSQHNLAGLKVLEGIRWDQEQAMLFPEETQVVVIQRDLPRYEDYYRRVIDWATANTKPVIYELDDLLTELPDDHPEKDFYAASRPGMLEAMHNADAVVVSTLELVNYARQYNPNTWLLPNYIDDHIWSMKLKGAHAKRSPWHRPIVIGYMGGLTKTHLPDLELITPLLRRLLMRYKERLRLRFWGVCPPELEGLPNVEFPQEKFPNYLDFARFFSYQDCDLFVAPLRKNLFNSSKSSIKYLEYSSLGIPGIYSRLAPYERVVRDGWNGFLADDELEWEERITRLIEDHKLRIEMGKAAYQTVDKNWRMSQHAHEWGTIYRAALACKLKR